MKKIEEVKKHLNEYGYTIDSLDKIFKFLRDVRVIDGDNFEMEGIHGDLPFEDFIAWFYTETKEDELKQATDELKENIDKLKETLANMDKNHPMYGLTKSVCDLFVEIAEDTIKESQDCVEYEMDMFEKDCHESLDNIFSALHSGMMDEREKSSVIDALSVLVALGDEYEG